jgi:hypothetical protein
MRGKPDKQQNGDFVRGQARDKLSYLHKDGVVVDGLGLLS